jgi:hypothetical protein
MAQPLMMSWPVSRTAHFEHLLFQSGVHSLRVSAGEFSDS